MPMRGDRYGGGGGYDRGRSYGGMDDRRGGPMSGGYDERGQGGYPNDRFGGYGGK